ncbi:hypothetical protein EYF80_032137 [Liparis tanakae]|uniref:Uncharacterized protein n=1 Tax=Liparis tanakae TaxID=230148 RepID=A0A4Z2GX42_9TELE|nr:hypothetical protein EYF80_032137 [Liparis tanakae]
MLCCRQAGESIIWKKGYGLETMRMHQLRGQVVCLRQKKTTGASSGKGNTRVLSRLHRSSGPISLIGFTSASFCQAAGTIITHAA